MAFIFRCLLSCLLPYLSTANVLPTHNNETHHYYIAPTSNLNHKTIICNATYCHIICNSTDACHDSEIDASLSDILIIECSELASCAETKIIHGPSTQAIIKCTARSSCHDAEFNIIETDNVVIECNDTNVAEWAGEYPPCQAQWDLDDPPCADAKFVASNSTNITIHCNSYGCYQTQFFLQYVNTAHIFMDECGTNKVKINASNISNHLNMECKHIGSCRSMELDCPFNCNVIYNCMNFYSCRETYIDIYDETSDLQVNCNTDITTACYPVYFRCKRDSIQATTMTTRYEWSSDRQRYQCNENKCCPDNYLYDGQIICDTNINCTINCQKPEDCLDIDATTASFLLVDCRGDYLCSKTVIHASVLELFYLNCSGSSACSEMIIYDTIIQNQLIYHCNKSACVDTHAEFILENDANVELVCAAAESELSPACEHATFIFNGNSTLISNRAGNVSVVCEYGSCNQHNHFIFKNIKTVSVFCNHPSACPNITWSNIGNLNKTQCECSVELTKKPTEDIISIVIITLVIVIVVVVIMGIVFYIYWRNKQQKETQKHQEEKQKLVQDHQMDTLLNAKTTIKKPMVLAFVISTSNINNNFNKFQNSFGYDVFPSIDHDYWPHEDLLDCLEEKRNQLQDQIPEFDGLIVIIKSMGNKDNIISSDERFISKREIENIFNHEDDSRIRAIQKIFVYETIVQQQSVEFDELKEDIHAEIVVHNLSTIINVYQHKDTQFIYKLIDELESDLNQQDILKRAFFENVAQYILRTNLELQTSNIILMEREESVQLIKKGKKRREKDTYEILQTDDSLFEEDVPTLYSYPTTIQMHQTHWDGEHLPQRPSGIQDLKKPLSQMSIDDICCIIKYWIYNDIEHKNNILKTQKIFQDYKLSGELMISLPKNGAKNMVEKQLSTFMTRETLDIIFKHYGYGQSPCIKYKVPRQLAKILYNYPLDKLIQMMWKQNVNGVDLMNIILTGNFIGNITGWRELEVYQIESILLTYQTFTKTDIHNNINMNGTKHKLPNIVINDIKKVIDKYNNHNSEQLHYDIKNGRNIDEFCKNVGDMVDILDDRNEEYKKENLYNEDTYSDEDFVKQIYDFVAECFIYRYENDSLMRKEIWTCYNCGNVNFNSVINKEEHKYPKVCILCGLAHADSIALELRGQNTFLKFKVPVEHKTYEDDVDKNIDFAIKARNIDLTCPNRNDNKQCAQILDVARTLIKYQRWLQKISDNDRRYEMTFTVKLDVIIELGLDIDKVVSDYQHIINYHINDGNKKVMKNTFEFFNTIVHYDDVATENCISQKRRNVRLIQLHKKNNTKTNNEIGDRKQEDESKLNRRRNIDTWEAAQVTQHYAQTQLDMIHSNLVHPKERRYVPTDDNEPSFQRANSAKYVTDSLDAINYVFGNHMHHPHLSPRYPSSVDELLYNQLRPIEPTLVRSQMAKAEKYHTKSIKNSLKSTYCLKDFNILRNESISIRHIFAIIIYTDLSLFCKKFRSTYRRSGNGNIIERHRQVYYLARALFEAVEFFGTKMSNKDFVYHGLDKILYFDKFQTYFNQPVSTTTLGIARRFSTETGIILMLKSPIKSCNNPKYLNVSTFSCYVEEEKLFYGDSVQFQIADVIEPYNSKSHQHELKLLTKFQKTVQNQEVDWNCSELIQSLVSLINLQQGIDKENYSPVITYIDKYVYHYLSQQNVESKIISQIKTFLLKEEYDSDVFSQEFLVEQYSADKAVEFFDEPYITDYVKNFWLRENNCISTLGICLFDHFCTSPNTSWIRIKNFKSLPYQLKKSLFNTCNLSKIELYPLLQLFPNLETIVLNELDLQDIIFNCEYYTEAVLNLLLYVNKTSYDTLVRVSFKSKCLKQNEQRENLILGNMAKGHSKSFQQFGWSINYQYQEENIQELRFLKNT
eukprot:220769_1